MHAVCDLLAWQLAAARGVMLKRSIYIGKNSPYAGIKVDSVWFIVACIINGISIVTNHWGEGWWGLLRWHALGDKYIQEPIFVMGC